MAYTNDLRIRVVNYFLQHEVQYREVATLFQIGAATVYRWVERFNRAGTIDRDKQTGRQPLIQCSDHLVLTEFVLKNSDSSLATMAEKWREEHGQTLSASAFGRTIARAGLTYKKNSSRYGT